MAKLVHQKKLHVHLVQSSLKPLLLALIDQWPILFFYLDYLLLFHLQIHQKEYRMQDEQQQADLEGE